MKPRIKLAGTETSEGGKMSLYEHDGDYAIIMDGQELMVSRANASERLLGTQGVAKLRKSEPARVLIGGLGLGFTLRSVLEAVGPDTLVDVVELMPVVVEWNRTHLQGLNGAFLDDPRVNVLTEDVIGLIQDVEPGTYDVVLLDIDNGPDAMVTANNKQLYTRAGLHAVRTALNPGGRAVFWSAGANKQFEARLAKIGFKVKAVPAKIHEGSRQAAYMLYVADQ
ncbi:MAG: spermine synthase [Verrucomicrobiota bacterium]